MVDAQAQRITNNAAADKLLTYDYREPDNRDAGVSSANNANSATTFPLTSGHRYQQGTGEE